MAIERIDSLFALPEIQQEFAAVKAGLADSQKGLVDLYNLIKGFKDTNISNLSANSEKLAQAINGSVQATANAAKNYEALTQKIAQQTGAVRDNLSAITGTNQAYDQLIKQSVRNKLAQDELAKSAKEVKAAFDKGETTFEQYAASLESIKVAQQQLKISNQDITKGLNNLEKQAQSSGTSVDGLKAKLNLLTQAYDKLSEEERASEGGQALLKNLNETDAAYKKLKEDSGRFQDTVGNYKGAFQEAFKVLKDELSAVNKQMGDLETKGSTVVQNLTGGGKIGFDPNRHKGDVTSFTKAGGQTTTVAAGDAAAYAQLSQKQELLNKLVNQTTIGFKTSRQEVKAFSEAATQLGLEIGLEDKQFQKFNAAVGEAINEINDLKASTKYQAQDAKIIVGLADAAATVAAGFGAAQAAQALFGDENKDLEKQLAKFQQILVLINSLQQIANGLQEESAGIQLLMAVRSKLATTAEAARALVVGKAAQVVAAETAATVADTVAKEADTAATIELVGAEELASAACAEFGFTFEAQAVAATEATAATTVNTAATVANAAAQGTAAKASKGFAEKLGVGGVAGLSLAAGIGLALLTAKLIGFGEKTELTTEQQKDLAEATRDLIDALEGQAKILEVLDSTQGRYYQNLISQAQAAGASQYALILAQQRYDKAQAESAQAEVDRLNATDANFSEAAHKAQLLRDQQQALSEELEQLTSIPESKRTGRQNDLIEDTKNRLAALSPQIENAEKKFNDMAAARNKVKEFNDKTQEDETRFQKLSYDEQLSAIERFATLRANILKAKNALILSDDASTLVQRLAAFKSNLTQEESIINAQVEKIKNNPSNKINGLLTPDAQGQVEALMEKQKEIVLKSQDDINKVRRQYYERDRDARFNIYKTSIDESLRYEQNILSRKIGHDQGDVTGDAKANALVRQLQLNKQLAEQERQKALDERKFSRDDKTANDEKLAIQREYDSKIRALDEGYLRDFQSLTKEIQQATLSDWDQYYEERKTQLDKETNAEIAALNDRLVKRKISQQKYDDELKLINDQNALNSINLEVMNDYIKVQAYKDGTKEKADAEKKLTADLKAQNDQQTKNELDKQAIARAKVLRTMQDVQAQADEYSDAILSVISIGYNAQKAHLDELESRQQKSYEQQVKNIQDSAATEEQKAIRLKILDGQRQAEKEANDRKQRQLDIQKAQFDKAKAIMDIILNTAIQVTEHLGNPALAVAIGIAGAAQLAAAIATPLPHYKEGTLDHAGGEAVTGDGGVKELILEPGRPARWSKDRPTIEKLMPHTKVIPPHKIEEWLMAGMFVNQQGALVDVRQDDNKKELREIKEALIWQTQRLENAASKNRGRTIVQNRIDTNWGSYLNEAVFHRK